MFARVAIVNRGEAAMRFIHAAREWVPPGGGSLTTVALHAPAERGSMFVREADESVELDSPRSNPYLDLDALGAALHRSEAEAAWVGWGFVAEDPAFAELCEQLGVVFIGPPAAVMRQLGDKVAAKTLAEEAGVPVAPWSRGPIASVAEAERHARSIGYPLLVKAAAGGGGRGIRRVAHADELADAYAQARREAESAFGDPTVFLEALVAGARHVEAQVVADNHGTVWVPGVRDCSIQRRNQKVIEESASTALDEVTEAQVRDAAARLAGAAGYRGAGTVEFLYQPEHKKLAFLEVNTRLQVEHPVTEMVTGLDLVKLQLHVAAGGRLDGDSPSARGHAIEARLNAEDPDRGFLPAPGTIAHLVWPSGPGIRVETGVAAGDAIPPEYDSMIAKIVAWGADRPEALARLRRGLRETTVLVRGGTTNKAFLLDLLDAPAVVDSRLDTGWLDRLMAGGDGGVTGRPDVALVATAIDAFDARTSLERSGFLVAAARGRPQSRHEIGEPVDLSLGGTAYRVTVRRTGLRRYRVGLDGTEVDVDVETLGPYERRLRTAGQRFRVQAIEHRSEALVEVDGVPHRVTSDDGGMVRSPAPGMVVAITVDVDEVLPAGARVAVIESMKMEVAVTAPTGGRVRAVLAALNTQVDAGAPMVRIDAAGDGPAEPSERIGLDRLAVPAGARASRVELLEALRGVVLGYDFSPAQASRLATAYSRNAANHGDPQLLERELDVLAAFADICTLHRNRRVGSRDDGDGANQREYFHAYLQTLDADPAGTALPPSFVDKLAGALAHYDVHGFDRTPALEEALYRIHLAQYRASTPDDAIVGLLQRPLRRADTIPAALHPRLLAVLDRLIVATQLRYPVLGDLARSARFRVFDQPFIDAERARVAAAMRDRLAALAHGAEGTVGPEGDDDLRALVDCPQPLIDLMPELEDPAMRRALVEVLTRRYYQIRAMHDVGWVRDDEGNPLVTAGYRDGEREMTVVAADMAGAELLEGKRPVAPLAALTAPFPSVLDLYAEWNPTLPDAELLASRLCDTLERAALVSTLERVTVTATAPGTTRRFSFERIDGAFQENRALRDLHPLIAERLNFWRLANFDVTRLPSPGHVYLFHCTARHVPGDERLVALAEVRDLTPLRDASGAVAALPELESVLAACLDAIRRALVDLPPRRRPQWNRVQLYGWPVVDVPVGEFATVIRALAPLTDGLGLEQVAFQGRVAAARAAGSGIEQPGAEPREVVVRVSRPSETGLRIRVTEPPRAPLAPIDDYGRKVLAARRRGAVYPYELIPLLVRSDGDGRGQDQGRSGGRFEELDLDDGGALVPVDRPYGHNRAGIVVGRVSTPTDRHPEGMQRIALLGDPTRSLGSLAEAECRRVIAALDLAEREQMPVEWFTISSGAKIAIDSGTENLDWVARALRRIVTFTQAGGEINVVVAGINVGAQPYWNAEATMLMHTRGILVMTPDSAMVLTGKQALEYSGGVAAEDNFGIGGYDTVMGPNGEAQYWAPDLAGAVRLLFAHYRHTYVAPGERWPRRHPTADPVDRDVTSYPHLVEGVDFAIVGDVFSPVANPERKKPFDIRTLIEAVVDADHTPLERWPEMRDAETAVVVDACLAGNPVCVIGVESRPLPRRGLLPADGPSTWTAGTLFPRSSKKVARAINAASGNRPVVVLANLSGFDGSPDSLRNLQLEYGAEIGRALVNFDGPIVFCVVSRYHGGAFVVFSRALNDHLQVAAVEGSYASVIGGAPAAAVVFTAEVESRTDADARLHDIEARIAAADDGVDGAMAAALRAEREQLREVVRAEKLGQVADEFERTHSIERAKAVGSIDTVISADQLRPYLAGAVERGMAASGGSDPRGR